MIRVFGVRHHGPGSARSVRAALEAMKPDMVLVEGPPDAQEVLPLIGHREMKPPVALLVYASDAPSRAVFYPFAVFSPEWQAISHALAEGVPARFIDLPFGARLGESEIGEGERTEEDPLAALAQAAGYGDRELWWEHHIEQRGVHGAFEAILEAMAALREGRAMHRLDAQREAHMRAMIRLARKQGYGRIAVVCGAWHAPALTAESLVAFAEKDRAWTFGAATTKTEAAWIPWTHSRLSLRSGYGAGIAAPGWYAHLWAHPGKDAALGWLSRVVRLLREADIEAPTSGAIDALRLAEALAALRGLAAPGLVELTDAARSVLCRGEEEPLGLIRAQLEVGNELGDVPEDAPQVPLQRDVAAAQKRLRMKPTAEPRTIKLDLRTPVDRAKSHFLHRLNAIGAPWGQPMPIASNKTGSFHEHWTLLWRPELTVSLVEASLYGNTLAEAATARMAEDARGANLARLTALLDAAILADLPEATDRILHYVEERAARSADVVGSMEALPPLARTTRYGSTRQTRTEHLEAILDGLFERIAVGLIPACAGLDDDAAARMLEALLRVHESITLLDRPRLGREWTALLHALIPRDDCHGILRGGACRLLVERGDLGPKELERLAHLALSPAARPAHAAAWLEGLLHGSALLLLHHDGLWHALDAWLLSLPEEAFVEMLPLVRRGFANFGPAERRQIGERVRRMGEAGEPEPPWPDLDPARAALVFPVLSRILGVELP